MITYGQALQNAAPELINDAPTLSGDQALAACYVSELARHGTSKLVANAASRPMLLKHDSLRLPVTCDDGGYGRTYVASPHSTYVLYARDEIEIMGLERERWVANAALGALDRLLRMIRINHAVHLDNWLLSTNLHGDWDGAALPRMREFLAERFPDHFVVIRSLDPWSCPALLDAAHSDGWTMLPSRQIWVTDDPAHHWRHRNHFAKDRRMLVRSGLALEDLAIIDETDARRIAELYRQLYLGRYSSLNPEFTPHFIQLSAQMRLLNYRVARDAKGQIMAAIGMRSAGGIATLPLLGYDMSRPQEEALYRIANAMSVQWTMERDLRLNGSAGASVFKRNRGAQGIIEYMAVYGGHLSRARRAGLALLSQALQRIMVPILTKQGW